MSSRTSMLPILLLPLGLTLTACEEKATDADMVALMERVAVLESQVGDVPTGDGDALSDRVTALEDDMGDAQESLVAANTLISENQIGVALNEATIMDVEADLGLAEGDIVENSTAISEAGTAIAALEDSVGVMQELIDAAQTSLTALGADFVSLAGDVARNGFAISDLESAVSSLEDAYGDLVSQVTSIEMTLAAIDITEVAALVDGVSEDLVDLEADVYADMAYIEADVADLDGRGEVWYETGSGTGTCARATVTTTLDRPLMVLATVTASVSDADGCTSSTNPGCYSTTGGPSTPPIPSTVSLGDSGTVTIDAQDSTGSYSYSESRTEQVSFTWRPHYDYVSGAYYYDYSGYFGVSQDWTVPIHTVLNIPSAGTYTVDLDVTGFSGACTLVVVQP